MRAALGLLDPLTMVITYLRSVLAARRREPRRVRAQPRHLPRHPGEALRGRASEGPHDRAGEPREGCGTPRKAPRAASDGVTTRTQKRPRRGLALTSRVSSRWSSAVQHEGERAPNDGIAVFEAVHGEAADLVGKDFANPLTLVGSAVLTSERRRQRADDRDGKGHRGSAVTASVRVVTPARPGIPIPAPGPSAVTGTRRGCGARG